MTVIRRWARGPAIRLLIAAVCGLVVAGVGVALYLAQAAGQSLPGPESAAAVAPDSLRYLVVPETELPFASVLWRASTDGSALQEVWFGPVSKTEGALFAKASHSVHVRVEVAPTSQDAATRAGMDIDDVAEAPENISSREPFVSYGDHAWYWHGGVGSGRVLFTRGNVLVDVHASRKGMDPQVARDLAGIVSRKLDAVSAGKPEAAAILPPSAEDWGVDGEGAWAMRGAEATFWGSETTTILLQGPAGILRSAPAKRLAAQDYLIPLRMLKMVFPDMRLRGPSEAEEAVIGGTKVVFETGSSRVEVGEERRPAAMASQAQVRQGYTIVPLSFLTSVLGYQIVWETQQGLPSARFAAPAASTP